MLPAVSVLALTLPFLGFLAFMQHGEEFLVAYEVSVSAAAGAAVIAVLLKSRNHIDASRLSLFALAMLSLAGAEGICGISFLRNSIGMRGQSYAELFYVVFWAGLVCLMRWHYGPINRSRSVVVSVGLAVIFLLSYWLQCRFIFPTFNAHNEGLFGLLYMQLWIVLKSTALVMAMAYSARAVDAPDIMFLQSVVALFCAGFSAAYQAVMRGFGSMCWFEAAWASCLGAIFVALMWSFRRNRLLFSSRPRLSEWYSLRAALGIAVFVANIVVLASVALLDMLVVGQALSISVLLLLMFGAWAVANAFAYRVSAQVKAALEQVPTRPEDMGQESPLANLHRYASCGAPLLSEFSAMLDRYILLSIRAAELARAAARAEGEAEIGRLAAQVAHDIRSPLAALQLVLKDVDVLPPTSRDLARMATQRVQDIATELLRRSRRRDANADVLGDGQQAALMSGIVSDIVAEKRLRYREASALTVGYEVDADAAFAFVQCNRGSMAAALSNVVDNAVEALDQHGHIAVRLRCEDAGARLLCSVSDDGPGIPKDILARLGQKGATFGKVQGNGLGLYGARCAAEEAGGSLRIDSQVGRGTNVVLDLPTCAAPEWFADTLHLANASRVAVVDDDRSIHRIWDARLEPLVRMGLTIEHLSGPGEFTAWMSRGEATDDTCYLIDFHYTGSDITGLDLIDRFKLAGRAILVSSGAECERLARRCQAMGVRALPKTLATRLPIRHALLQGAAT